WLATFVSHARSIIDLARPTTAHLLRALDGLTAEEITELGRWNLDKAKSEHIIDRLTAELGEQREVVRETFSRCLRLDLWSDNFDRDEALEQTYQHSGSKDAEIEQTLGRPPSIYPFVLHGGVYLWHPEQEEYCGLIIEDDQRWAICKGYLVAR